MKLVDFLEQFTPAKFDWEKADDLWLELADKYKIDDRNINVGDWVEVQPAFIALFDLIRAGAFEDYPQPLKGQDNDAIRFNNFETIPDPWKPSKIIRVHQEQMRRKYGVDE